MEKTVILNLSDKKPFFSQAFQREEYDDVSVVTIKNSRRALRKFARFQKTENILISHERKNEEVLKNHIKEFDKLSYKTAMPVISTICRCVADKYDIKLPFAEIYIVANPEVAYEFIIQLQELSRMFTVISDKGAGKEADELYFEYGCIIRHVKKTDSSISKDSIVIRIEDRGDFKFETVPVINMAKSAISGKNVISAHSVTVSDEKIENVSRLWGGRSGLLLYELIAELPGNGAKVDINKEADRIFLLDTSQF